MIASKNGRLDVVRFLLTAGADVNLRALFGRSPIKMAVRSKIADYIHKWPFVMAMISLQELRVHFQLDCTTLIDLWQYISDNQIGNEDDDDDENDNRMVINREL